MELEKEPGGCSPRGEVSGPLHYNSLQYGSKYPIIRYLGFGHIFVIVVQFWGKYMRIEYMGP